MKNTNRLLHSSIVLCLLISLFSAQFLNVYAAGKSADSTNIITEQYGDYSLQASGQIPDGLEIKRKDVVSVADITDAIQAQITDGRKVVTYYTANIELLLNGEPYTFPAGESITIKITGPVVRGTVTGALTFYSGSDVSALQMDDTAAVSEFSAEFKLGSSAVIAVADITDHAVEYPVNDNLIIDENKVVANPASADSNNEKLKLFSSAADKSSLSSYTNPYLPTVRNQGSYGSCWAFAATALVELSAISQSTTPTSAKSIDLSELQLAYYTYNLNGEDPLGLTSGDTSNNSYSGYGKYLSTGGNIEIAAMTAMNWIGMANENDVQYSSAPTVLQNGLSNVYQYSKDKYHVQDVYDFNVKTATGITLAKQFISQNGGIGIAYNANAGYYSSENNSYYCSGGNSADHAVTVVGWDDTFSKDRFNGSSARPSGDGAWLVRNSWGSDNYNYYGYFWLSYYDTSLYWDAYAISTDTADNYDNNYHYDGGIFSDSYGYSYSYDAANVFTAKANQNGTEEIKAVSVDLYSPDVSYTVSIYTNLTDPNNPESGTLAGTKSGTTKTAGYYTVKLDQPIAVTEGTKFSVVFHLTPNSGNGAYISTEHSYVDSENYASFLASGSAGQGFVRDSSTNVWQDFYTTEHTETDPCTNLRIKAYTDNVASASVPLTGIALSKTSDTLNINDTLQLSVSYTPADSTTDRAITWNSSNANVASVDNNGKITARAAGSATITATSSNGKTASCSITVNAPYISVNGISLNTGSLTLNINDSSSLSASVSPSNANNKGVTWSSSDTSVATVDGNGTVYAVNYGSAVITARTSESGYTASCNVTVLLNGRNVTQIKSFVNTMYNTVLNRYPDQSGLDYWVSQLANGYITGSAVAYDFVFSSEFIDKNYCNNHYVTHVYNAVLGRNADASGLSYWSSRLSSGTSREEILNGFLTSSEFTAKCLNAGIVRGDGISIPLHGTIQTWPCPEDGILDNGISNFVLRMYTKCLGRAAEKEGASYWSQLLNNQAISGTQVANNFFTSTEFEAHQYSNSEYITRLYRTFFDREGDSSGMNYWTNMMSRGLSRRSVLLGFADSSEWRTICSNYGIPK